MAGHAMHIRPLVLLFVTSLSPLAHAVQDPHAPAAARANIYTQASEVTLEATGLPLATSERLEAVLAPVVCDQDQNLYFRKMSADPGASLLQRISANGKSTAIYDASKLPNNSREIDLLAFAVDAHGKVYEFVRAVEGKRELTNYILAFSKDGELVSHTKVELDLIPSAFTALETGDYFVSGTLVKQSRDDQPGSVTAILDSSGRMKLDLKVSSDDAPLTSSKDGVRTPDGTASNSKLTAIENGTSLYGPDKNVYLFRASDPVELKVFSPAGMVLRHQQLRAPFSKAVPFEFRLAGSRVLVGFRTGQTGKDGADASATPRYVIFDAQSGEPILQYRFGESIRGALACFSGDRFTFLTGNRSGHFAILDAKAK